MQFCTTSFFRAVASKVKIALYNVQPAIRANSKKEKKAILFL